MAAVNGPLLPDPCSVTERHRWQPRKATLPPSQGTVALSNNPSSELPFSPRKIHKEKKIIEPEKTGVKVKTASTGH